MSLSSLSQTNPSTLAINPRLTTSARASNAIKASARALSNAQLLQSSGLSQGLSTGSTSTLNAAYNTLLTQTSVGQSTAGKSTIQSLLARYLQNTASTPDSAAVGSYLNNSA